MGSKTMDVVIAGGGPAGSAAAISLARLGYRVAIIERSNYNAIRFGETLHPNIRTLLMQLDSWDPFISSDPLPSFGIQSVWGKNELHENNFIFNPFGNGWHLDRVQFDRMLSARAQDAGVIVDRGARILSCTDDIHGNWTISSSSDNSSQIYHARILIDATGRSSFIARKKNATRIKMDRLIGIVSFLPSGSKCSAQRGYTLIESAEDGWWYSADIPGSNRVVVFMTDSDLYQQALRRSRNYWIEQLKKTGITKNTVAFFDMNLPLHVVASNTSKLDRVAGRNWMAIGDAAMSFDPLSSKGIYKALESGLVSAKIIDRRFAGNRKAFQLYPVYIDQAYDRYTDELKFYYRRERRWPDSGFWRRRQSNSLNTRVLSEMLRPGFLI